MCWRFPHPNGGGGRDCRLHEQICNGEIELSRRVARRIRVSLAGINLFVVASDPADIELVPSPRRSGSAFSFRLLREVWVQGGILIVCLPTTGDYAAATQRRRRICEGVRLT